MPRAAAVSRRSVSSSVSCSSRHRASLSQRRSVLASCSSSSKRVSRRLLSLTLPPSLVVLGGSTSPAVADEEKLQLSSRQRAAQLDGLTQLAYQKIAENHVRSIYYTLLCTQSSYNTMVAFRHIHIPTLSYAKYIVRERFSAAPRTPVRPSGSTECEERICDRTCLCMCVRVSTLPN